MIQVGKYLTIFTLFHNILIIEHTVHNTSLRITNSTILQTTNA